MLPAIAGVYTFRLYATDGMVEGSDTLQIAIVESMCPPGDLTEDCVVDLSDLRMLASEWLADSGASQPPSGDLNGQDGVDLVDYSLLAASWRQEGPSIVINEFMAINSSKYPLEQGELLHH